MLDRPSSASLGLATDGRVGDAQLARLGSKGSSAVNRPAMLGRAPLGPARLSKLRAPGAPTGRTLLGPIQLPKPGGPR
jgi:hypothetical protein